MKVEVTFGSVWNGEKIVTAVIEFDAGHEIKEIQEAMPQTLSGWDGVRFVERGLARLLADEMSVSIIE